MSASISCRSRVSRTVLSSPRSATDAPKESIVATIAVSAQALSTFIGSSCSGGDRCSGCPPAPVETDHRGSRTGLSMQDQASGGPPGRFSALPYRQRQQCPLQLPQINDDPPTVSRHPFGPGLRCRADFRTTWRHSRAHPGGGPATLPRASPVPDADGRHRRAADRIAGPHAGRALDRFAEWGLANPPLEPFEFGRGWQLEQLSVAMTEPRYVPLVAYADASSPSTSGVLS